MVAVGITRTPAAKTNVWCEVGEWGAGSFLLGSSFIIDRLPPVFHKPLIGGPTERRYVAREAVNAVWLGVAAGGVGTGILLLPNRDGCWNQTGYRNAKGYFEAMAVTKFLTDAAKIVTGRKRPDYDDRFRVGADTVDGRKSFWSGHVANSFSTATYASLYAFGQVGDNRNPVAVGAKTALTLGLHALAGWVAWTRIDEHKHHPADVITGALVGSATSVFFYGLHNGWWHKKNSNGRIGGELSPAGFGISLTIPLNGYNNRRK